MVNTQKHKTYPRIT